MASDTPTASAALEFLKELTVAFRPEVAAAHQKDLERVVRLRSAISALHPTADHDVSDLIRHGAQQTVDAVAMSDLRAAAAECASGLFIGIPIHLDGSWEVPMILYNGLDHPVSWIAHSGTSVAADEDTVLTEHRHDDGAFRREGGTAAVVPPRDTLVIGRHSQGDCDFETFLSVIVLNQNERQTWRARIPKDFWYETPLQMIPLGYPDMSWIGNRFERAKKRAKNSA